MNVVGLIPEFITDKIVPCIVNCYFVLVIFCVLGVLSELGVLDVECKYLYWVYWMLSVSIYIGYIGYNIDCTVYVQHTMCELGVSSMGHYDTMTYHT